VRWTVPAVLPASSASSPCQASLVTVILANSVSQETGSDLGTTLFHASRYLIHLSPS